MAHPRMFDPDDPILARVRELALGFPGAAEKVSHGRPAFYTKKVFAYYGGSVRRAKDDWIQYPQSVMLLLDAEERAALEQQETTFVPAYLGPSGWLGIDLTIAPDYEELAELIEMSYRRTAPASLVKELDAGGS